MSEVAEQVLLPRLLVKGRSFPHTIWPCMLLITLEHSARLTCCAAFSAALTAACGGLLVPLQASAACSGGLIRLTSWRCGCNRSGTSAPCSKSPAQISRDCLVTAKYRRCLGHMMV